MTTSPISQWSGLTILAALITVWGCFGDSAPESLEVEVLSAPDRYTNETEAEFAFDCNAEWCGLTCRINDGEQLRCGDDPTVTGLDDGPHELLVKAADGDGRTSAPKRLEWTIDTEEPELDIALYHRHKNDGARHTDIDFECANKDCAAFRCRIDRDEDEEDWEACEPPVSIDTELGQEVRFHVHAEDKAGNEAELDRWWFHTNAEPDIDAGSTDANFEERCIIDDGVVACADDDPRLELTISAKGSPSYVDPDTIYDEGWQPHAEEFQRLRAGEDEAPWTDWTRVDANPQHACGLRADASLWCWGADQPGSSGGTFHEFPERIATPEADDESADEAWLDVATGYQHSCAVRDDGTLWCWGHFRHLGAEKAIVGVELEIGGYECGTRLSRRRSAASYSTTPTKVLDNTGRRTWSDWVHVDAHRHHTCAIREDDSRWCWGQDERGDTFGDDDYYPVPVRVDDDGVSEQKLHDDENSGEVRYIETGGY